MREPNDFNQALITEFRANGGRILQGPFAGRDLLLLTTRGARSGQLRTNPLAYTTDADRLVVIASKAGAPTNPDWYHNLRANPEVTVEVGTERYQARAVVVADAERERLFAQMAAKLPGFAAYQQKTTRQIPVVVLERLP